MDKIEKTLTVNKETKNSVRFQEETDDHPLTVYLLKSEVADLGNPQSIRVTIEAA